jgi:predicted peptidase
MNMKNLILAICMVLTFGVSAQQKYSSNEYYGREYRDNGDTLKYRILYPPGYDAGIKFPLFIFLHGEDEKGYDNVLQLKYLAKIYKEQTVRDYYPAVVIVPQCPEHDSWAKYNVLDDGEIEIPDSPEETVSSRILAKLIENYMKKPYVDKTRVYIVGMSEGAFGALDMVQRHPEYFTAAVSVGGAIYPERFAKQKKVAVRFFHGINDKVVPISHARDVYLELKSNGCETDFVEYQETGHDAWTLAFSSSDFMEWIFDKSKKK